MVEGVAPQPNHRATVILGRGGRESWNAIGLAVNEALRVQSLDPGLMRGGAPEAVAEAIEVDDERILVVNTEALLGERPPSEGNRDG
jgi:hypothetical protein